MGKIHSTRQWKIYEIVSFEYITEKLVLTAAEISKIIQNMGIRALSNNGMNLSIVTIHECIKQELLKSNKVM